MAYTSAELTTFFTNASLGAAPSAAQSLLLSSYASQTQSGSLTDAAAISRIVDMLDGTTSVAVQTYQFFTGSTPSSAGLAYLVNSATNTNDLNDASGQYGVLNTENRFINFAINLGANVGGAGQATFAATYGTLSFHDVVAVAYETVIGTAAATAAGIDVNAAIAYLSRAENEAYLRGFVAAKAPGVNAELAIRAAVIGQIMSAGSAYNVGNYNAATTRLITGAMDGTFDNGITSTAGVDLLTAFPNVVAPTAFALTTGVDNVTGTAGADAITGTNLTLTALDTIDGGIGADTLTISDLAASSPLPAGLTVKNVETINWAASSTVNLDLSAAAGVTGVTNFNVTASTGNDTIKAAGQNVSVVGTNGTVTINGASASQTVTSAGGYILSGSTGAIKVTDTAQGGQASTIDGGTTVDLTTTTAGVGSVTIGGTKAPTGTVNVTENLKGTGASLNGGAITVTGGTVDTIKVNATQDTVGATTTIGNIAVNGAATATSVSVTQTAPVAGVAAVAASVGVTETASAVFTALAKNDTVTVGGLTFKAATATTAAQTAAAFANLTAGATQGNSTLGTYTGSLTAPYTSGAASTATVVFTATTANSNVADLTSASSTVPTIPALTITQGNTLTAAKAGNGAIVDGQVAITSSGNVLTTATVDGYATGSTLQSDALTSLSLANSASAGSTFAITNTKATTLGLTTSALASGSTLTAPTYTTLNVTTGATKSSLNVTGSAVQTLAVSGATAIDMSGSTFGALKTVTVSGAAGATLDASGTTVTSVDTSASTGTNTFKVDATKATFTGGAGVDNVTTSAAAPTKAISLGGGNDSLTLAAGTTSVTGAIDGGAGTDTLVMVAADAVTASASAAFATKVSGFEVLSLTGAVGVQAVDVAQLGAYTSVSSSASAGTLSLSNLASGGTLTITGNTAGVGYDVGVTNALTGTSDVLNIVLSKAGALTGGQVTAANVETITIAANDTTTPFVAAATHNLNLIATKATSVTVTGNANLNLSNYVGNTALTKIDGSAMTGALTFVTTAPVAGTVTGGSGNDFLTAGPGTSADVLIGGAGNDNLTANAGLDTLTGGAGRDTFVIATAGANVNVYSTITDASAGDTIQLAGNGTETFNTSKLVLGDTAVFQDYANLAAAGDGSTNAAISWFQYAGNTYIVEDLSAGTSFVNGVDIVVKLTGLVDLSTASLNTGTPTLLLG